MDTKQTLTLWQISKDVNELADLIADIQESEDLSPEEKEVQCDQLFEKWLNSENSFKQKILRIVPIIQKHRAIAEAAKAESKRLNEVAKYFDRSADRLESYTLTAMINTGIKKVEGQEGVVSLRKKPGELILDKEVEDLPQEYVRVTLAPKLAEIRKAVKAGTVDWAHIEDNGFSLTIK